MDFGLRLRDKSRAIARDIEPHFSFQKSEVGAAETVAPKVSTVGGTQHGRLCRPPTQFRLAARSAKSLSATGWKMRSAPMPLILFSYFHHFRSLRRRNEKIVCVSSLYGFRKVSLLGGDLLRIIPKLSKDAAYEQMNRCYGIIISKNCQISGTVSKVRNCF